MKKKIVNNLGCELEGEFTEEELSRFSDAGWKECKVKKEEKW